MYRSPTNDRMNLFNTKETKAQFILSLLPITLFFPIGIGYTVIVMFLVALLLGGHYRDRWQAIKDSPMFLPVMGLLVVTSVAGLFLERPEGFWKAFMHYQIYLVLLVFISVGAGRWQQRALNVFFAGAVLAATLFYLNFFQLLPNWALFQNYINYAGNKSILIGILLGIAGGWMLNEICVQHEHKWLRIAMLLYTVIALLFLAKTRTGSVIFIIGSVLVLLRHITFSWRSVLLVLGTVAIIAVAWQNATGFRERLVGTANDIKAFADGGKVSTEGLRLQMYRATIEMINEQPISGHGIGTWIIQYPERAKDLPPMATPHNDYLLYAAEIGIIGVCALLWIWLAQLVAAVRVGGPTGMRLFTIGVAIMFGGMVNAILRDALFGIAFMALLSIPLAGINRHAYRQYGDHYGDAGR